MNAQRNEEYEMGVNDAKQSTKESKERSAAEKRKRRIHGATGSGAADWSGANGELVCKAVAAVARGGGAIRLGYTRDGGAYAVGFYDGDDKHTEYISPNDDLDEFFRGVIEDYE